LSVKLPVKVTAVPTEKTEPLRGPVIVTTGLGFVTVTVDVHCDWLLNSSLAVHVIEVVPCG
jgi:hypothetical protein